MISERTIRPITLFKYVCSRANIVSKVRQKSKQNCDCVCVCMYPGCGMYKLSYRM